MGECMNFFQDIRKRKIRTVLSLAVVLAALSAWNPFIVVAASQNNSQDTPAMQDMPGMDMSNGSMSMEETPAQQATHLADKRESEFNHHLAGFLVIVAGFFLLIQDRLAGRWPGVRYVWPSCFLLAGVY